MADRKIYGSQPDDGREFTDMLPSAGDPEFTTDAQNNDEYFRFAADQIDAMGEDSEVEAGSS